MDQHWADPYLHNYLMKNKNKDLQIDLSILGITIFLVVASLLSLFGFDFYDSDVEIEGMPFSPFEVTAWMVAISSLVMLGLKAFFQNFSSISTNIILIVFGVYILFVFLSLWDAYNEVQDVIEATGI